MATESDLRDLLRGPEPEGRAAIDLDAVLTRAHRRRRPKVVVAQALGSVAAVGALVTGVVLTLPAQQPASMMVAEDSGAGDEYASAPQDADAGREGSLDACGEPATPWPILGWALDVGDGGGTAAAPVIEVTLRNDGSLTTSGEVEVTSMTFLRDGVVVAHGASTGATAAVLDADAALTWDVPVTVTPCDPAQPLEPGLHQVRAVVEYRYSSGGGAVVAEPIVGTPGDVELR